MTRNIKYGKIAIVIFLTCLIWIFADRALDEEYEIPVAMINIAKSANPDRLATLRDGQLSIAIKDIVLRGPASKITAVKKDLRMGLLEFDFILYPDQEGMTEPGLHSLRVPDFFRRSDKIKRYSLTVESCEPKGILVSVVGLVKKSLVVECFDESGASVKAESIEPAKVEMFVLEEWGGDKLRARVDLSRSDKQQARQMAVVKTPYIKLASGQSRDSATVVKIKLPAVEDKLQDYSIPSATIGFVFSQNLVGKYDIELLNPSDMATVSIKATPAAKDAYSSQPFQMILYIRDEYKDITEEQRRRVFYNFPEEFVQRAEIELKGPPVEALFKLVPLPVVKPSTIPAL